MDNKDILNYCLTINLNTICRVCLRKPNIPQRLEPIFNSSKFPSVSNLIMACASVQIIEDDGLPSHLCEDCLAQLEIAFQFKTKCEQSDLRLREYLCLSTKTTHEKQETNDQLYDVANTIPKCSENDENVFNIITNSMATSTANQNINTDNVIDTTTLLIDSTGSIEENNESQPTVNYTVFKPNFVINITDDIMTKSILIPNFPTDNDKIKVEGLLGSHNVYLNEKKEETAKISVNDDGDDLTSEFIILHKKHNSNDYEKENKNQDDIKLSSETKEIKYLTKRQRKFDKRNRKRTICKSNLYIPKLPKKHQCDTCGKVFKAKQGLIQHLRIHSGERPYVCHLCNKRFINGGHLHTHMRTHTGEKNHKCTECVKAFATSQQLQKHIIAIHTQDRPYQCSYCPKRCASSSNLTTHIRIHTGEKNYHCDRCPKAFSTKGQLLQHILIHTGQKPFLCEFCQKRFTQRAHLTRHMKMHRNS